jgi:hypothetical protein
MEAEEVAIKLDSKVSSFEDIAKMVAELVDVPDIILQVGVMLIADEGFIRPHDVNEQEVKPADTSVMSMYKSPSDDVVNVKSQ